MVELEGYRNFELLGLGPRGAVYRAVERHMAKPVAIKFFHRYAPESEGAVEDFHEDVQKLAVLNHPGIALTTECDAVRGQFYVVTELLEGKNLEQFIEDQGVIEIEESLEIVQQVARALLYARKNGRLHLNLKPTNVFVRVTKGTGSDQDEISVKVTDFRLERDGDPQRYSGSVGDTEEFDVRYYRAPEMDSPNVVLNEQADIFSLVALWYHLLAGEAPDEDAQPFAERMEGEEEPAILDFIDAIIGRGMNPDREERFKDFEELLTQLKEFKKCLEAESLAVRHGEDDESFEGGEFGEESYVAEEETNFGEFGSEEDEDEGDDEEWLDEKNFGFEEVEDGDLDDELDEELDADTLEAVLGLGTEEEDSQLAGEEFEKEGSDPSGAPAAPSIRVAYVLVAALGIFVFLWGVESIWKAWTHGRQDRKRAEPVVADVSGEVRLETPPEPERPESSAPANPLLVAGPLTSRIVLNPGRYDLLGLKITAGDRSHGDGDEDRIPAEIVALPGVEISNGGVYLDAGQFSADHVRFQKVVLTSNLHGKYYLKDSLLNRCSLAKEGWWTVKEYSAKWEITNCAISGSFFERWHTKTVGVKIQKCTFLNVNFRPMVYIGDPAIESGSEWRTIERCLFVDCEIPPSVLIATNECVFHNCTFPKDNDLNLGSSIDRKLYLMGTTPSPPEVKGCRFKVEKVEEAPFAGSNLRFAAGETGLKFEDPLPPVNIAGEERSKPVSLGNEPK